MRIALTGNPNSGKTTMYNALTGRNEKVGNWAGVTVEKKEHPIKKAYYGGEEQLIAVDLPGAYSMSPFTSEESITSAYVKHENPDVIINIVDATNLSRSLFFTTQLLELGIPVVVALNKSDINEKKDTKIDVDALSAKLGCPVIRTVSTSAEGLKTVVETAVARANESQLAPYSEGNIDLTDKKAVENADRERFDFVNKIVSKVETRKVLTKDKNSDDRIDADVQLAGAAAGTAVRIEIPELNVDRTVTAGATGTASASFRVRRLQRWSPADPKLYRVIVSTDRDRVEESIGFRNIRTEGEEIVLNGSPVFLKSISFHEEIPQRMGRAHSEADAVMLLSEAKALGCNMIRLAHYPQNEHIVRLAEKMGFLLWEEIPIWQGIDFANDQTREKAGRMIREMVTRDKNRCALTFWGVANETQPSGPRNAFLRHLIACCREIDDTRLIVAAFDLVRFDRQRQLFVMDDPFIGELDVVAINKYMGWYHPWPLTPDKAVWDVARGKPLIISEFGGEALYGQHGPADVASSWSEEYQEALYRDNLRMFENIPNLRGVSPWILFDFRSPFRFHPANQEGWNRKGLVSDQGYRKKAWYLMKAYYDKH